MTFNAATRNIQLPLRLSDQVLRSVTLKWIETIHQTDSDIGIINEFKIPRPSSRIDIALINGEISGFELKSDLDTLSRLPRQISSYSQVFDRVILVTTKKHLAHARKLVPTWWGIYYLADGQVTLRKVRGGRKNPHQRIDNLLHTLTKGEIKEICKSLQLRSKVFQNSKSEIIEYVSKQLSHEKIKEGCRAVLKNRSRAYSSPSDTSSI